MHYDWHIEEHHMHADCADCCHLQDIIKEDLKLLQAFKDDPSARAPLFTKHVAGQQQQFENPT